MKTPKCPICGVPLKPIRGYDVHGITTDWVAGCYNCSFQSSHFWKTKKACIEDMDRLVSLFPPIMRVWPGDAIVCDNVSRTVFDKDVRSCELVIKDEYGDNHTINPDDVDKWPWEIEQTEKISKSCDNCKYCTRPSYKSPCLECADCEDEAYKYWELDQKGGNE